MISKPDRKLFVALAADEDDAALEQLAASKGVGTLVTPEPETQASEPPTPPKAEPLKKPRTAATPRERMKAVNLELPDYVWTDLKIRAAKAQVSVRHIVMTALVEAGVKISEADLIEDGRRHR